MQIAVRHGIPTAKWVQDRDIGEVVGEVGKVVGEG